jgi:hypothetical protein
MSIGPLEDAVDAGGLIFAPQHEQPGALIRRRSLARSLSQARNSTSCARRERRRTILRSVAMIVQARRSLISNTPRTRASGRRNSRCH